MITQSFLYTQGDNLDKIIKKDNNYLGENCLINIFTPILNKENAVLLAKNIKKIFPKAKIFGSSVCAVIYNGEQYEDETLIVIEKYECAKIYTRIKNIKDINIESVVDYAIEPFEKTHPQMLKIMFGNYYKDAHAFVQAFNEKNTDIKMVGGVSGETSNEDITPYIFDDSIAIVDGMIMAGICDKRFHTYFGINISHEPISEVYTLTKATGTYWDSVEGVPAVEWFREYLGIKNMKEYSSWEEIAYNDPLIRFDMILENHNSAGRFLRYDEKENKISQYFTGIPSGTKFRIGYTSPQKCVEECYKICTEIMTKPIESIFCFSCLFRKLHLQNCAKWELTPFKEYNICGVFTLGEIAYVNDKHEFLNGASVMVGTAERENYIVPQTDVFGELYKIEDDTKELINFVIKKYSEAISGKNKNLLNILVEQQRISKIKMKFDQRLGMNNLNKYKEDEIEKGFNKLCFLQIENADLLINYFGQEKYLEYLKEALSCIESYIEKSSYDKYIYTYMINDTTFAMSAGKSVEENYFLHIMRKLYKNFQYIKIKTASVPIMSRFVVVLHQKNMIENAFNVLQANKNKQSRFIICDKDTSLEYSTAQELKMISVLNRVIKNNNITPYYQGIYDNYESKITKYEALMRIIDDDGSVYSPFDFMNIAKKYHMYSILSKNMIHKVFGEFKDAPVSINLSAYDITSEEFKIDFFKKIRQLENPENYTIEILEDEKFDDIEVLENFIEEVRSYGVKIAIDDFGSGYSNLCEIAKIKPDFLKIDGSIIKNITKNKQVRIILKTIIYLAKSLI